MPHACKHRIPSSSSAMPRGSTFTHSSLSRTIFRTWCRARSTESIAPVGPHPQMTTSVVSLSGCEDMRKSREANTLRQLIWFDEWQKSVKKNHCILWRFGLFLSDLCVSAQLREVSVYTIYTASLWSCVKQYGSYGSQYKTIELSKLIYFPP